MNGYGSHAEEIYEFGGGVKFQQYHCTQFDLK
jgi:hypothetical protein